MTTPLEPVIPLRALEHFTYCPRQAALIHVDGVWHDNEHTVRGVRGHQRVDTAPSRRERGRQVLRGIELWSERFGLIGRADAVEITAAGTVEPVEYKHGTRHGRAAEIQLCAQALCLEEMLHCRIDTGWVWYAAPRRRAEVPLGRELRSITADAIEQVRSFFTSKRLPPAPNDERCTECQLLGHCLPDLSARSGHVIKYVQDEVLTCG